MLIKKNKNMNKIYKKELRQKCIVIIKYRPITIFKNH